jgi:hypothetical protein
LGVVVVFLEAEEMLSQKKLIKLMEYFPGWDTGQGYEEVIEGLLEKLEEQEKAGIKIKLFGCEINFQKGGS